MPTYISILRGINVSGQRIIKMEALRALYAELGFENVQSLIQSGNVIFKHGGAKRAVLEHQIATGIQREFGFEVPVMVMEIEALKNIVENNPFSKDNQKNINYLHVTFLSAEPEKGKFDKMMEATYQDDEIRLIDGTIYLYCPNGYGKTRLNNGFLESKLGVTATTRNWKTTNQLLTLAEEIDKMR